MKHVICGLMVLVLVACDREQNVDETALSMSDAAKSDFMPLGIGYEWVYRHTMDDEASELVVSKITQVKTFNGATWFEYDESGDILWVRNSVDGQYEAVLEDVDGQLRFVDEELYFAIPVDGTEQMYSTFEGAMIILPHPYEVSVPAGDYKCYKYVYIEGDLRSTFYLAPGVGIVNNVIEYEGTTQVYELSSYSFDGTQIDQK